MTVALFTHPACVLHEPGAWHPECPDRLRVVLRALEGEAFSGLLREQAPEATREQLGRVHPAGYIDGILSTRPGPGELAQIDADTAMSEHSAEAGLRAAGGAVAAVDAVLDGWARAAFVATRPPGHHAEPGTPMGFCLFSNAAVAARHARARGVARIAVVDFDVHHGNGTQAALQGDAEMFYASTHQHPCYPGTGMASEQGVAGNVVNAPLAPGSGGPAFRAAWSRVILPGLEAFAPDLLIVSAGFDAHADDPLADIRIHEDDFAWLTAELVAIADRRCGGRIVSLLEGGYDLAALASSAAVHVRGLMRL